MRKNLADLLVVGFVASLAIFGCKEEGGSGAGAGSEADVAHSDDDDHDHDHAAHEGSDGHDHGQGEISLGNATIGDIEIEAFQGHGDAEPGKELHLVVKLPYNDNGATTIRAWIGTDDRLSSLVARAEYAPSHDDYDVHAVAPDPLPEGAAWWIEIEKPDGTKRVGSIMMR